MVAPDYVSVQNGGDARSNCPVHIVLAVDLNFRAVY
jgi:hypothetical protein